MKKILISLFILLVVFSCSEDFLERNPTDEVSTGVIENPANARLALNGIHRTMFTRRGGDSQDESGHNSNMIYAEILAEDVVMHANGNGWWVFDCRWQATENSSAPDYIWDFYYELVVNANTILNAIPEDGVTNSDAADIRAQALTYRAFAHFELVKFYGARYVAGAANDGLGVPIRITTGFDPIPRSTVEQVYTQINADLDAAEALFVANTPTRIDKSNFDVSVVRGLQARVALTQQNWTVARDKAIEARAGYTLMSNADYQSGFRDFTNSEWMWGSQQITDEQSFFASFFAYMSHNFSSTNIRTNPKKILNTLYAQIPTSDIRWTMWSQNGLPVDSLPRADAISTPLQNKKFRATDPGESTGDVPYMRASEMFLIEAEARFELGDEPGARQALLNLNNNTVARDPNYTLSVNTGTTLRDEIYFYRRIELWGEGHRWHDIKRRNGRMDRDELNGNHNGTTINFKYVAENTDPLWNIPVPIRAKNNNELLED